MPIFSKKFDIKTIPTRSKRHNPGCPQIQERIDDIQAIQINLNKKKLKFVDGMWVLTQPSCNIDEVATIKRQLGKVEEENNLNQIKVDVLLDMLTENLVELNALRSKSNI